MRAVLFKFVTLSLFLGIFSLANAEKIPLMTITNDDNNIVVHFGVVTDKSNRIVSLYGDSVYPDDKSKNKNDSYSLTKLVSKKGVVVKEVKKKKAVIFKSNYFSKSRGGKIVIDYMYNGIPWIRSRRNFNVDIQKINNRWTLVHKKSAISKVNLICNRKHVFGKEFVVGIKKIEILD
jgi:hypothetical protein